MLTSETVAVKVLAIDSNQGAKEFQTKLAEASKTQFSRDYSDHFALVRAYEGWKEVERDVAGYEYCWKNFLSAQSMKAIDTLRREFYFSLKEYVLNFNARFLIVEPDPGHTKLHISKEGLEAIQRITTLIAIVDVSLRLIFLNIY
ncbi:hypothetical protein LOK49_LG04G00493 [Camellia lanceoleosa]|uniref:Uncharacterized protein n=1 Tax=Camellia lanceoleosa TaxID=1840588 RepID=A0ACC0I2Q1_9ERIC|nr:hypothetical protein LOK49_LG04G00493 [Camellia lanceoleosa]